MRKVILIAIAVLVIVSIGSTIASSEDYVCYGEPETNCNFIYSNCEDFGCITKQYTSNSNTYCAGIVVCENIVSKISCETVGCIWDLEINARGPIDEDGDGYSGAGDCDDTDPNVYLGASEKCDNLDNDCDGDIDEGLTQTCSTACGSGTETCNSGVWEGCTAQKPTTEICVDGIDNDCDEQIDEEGALGCTNLYRDYDGDGYGLFESEGGVTCLCDDDEDWKYYYVEKTGDCNDIQSGNPDFCDDILISECSKIENNVCAKCINPDATEICADGIDNDCDTVVDEDTADNVCTLECPTGYVEIDDNSKFFKFINPTIDKICYIEAQVDGKYPPGAPSEIASEYESVLYYPSNLNIIHATYTISEADTSQLLHIFTSGNVAYCKDGYIIPTETIFSKIINFEEDQTGGSIKSCTLGDRAVSMELDTVISKNGLLYYPVANMGVSDKIIADNLFDKWDYDCEYYIYNDGRGMNRANSLCSYKGYETAEACYYVEGDNSGDYIVEDILPSSSGVLNDLSANVWTSSSPRVSKVQCIGVCGNGVVATATEECDDGNNIDGDGCSSDCKWERRDNTDPLDLIQLNGYYPIVYGKTLPSDFEEELDSGWGTCAYFTSSLKPSLANDYCKCQGHTSATSCKYGELLVGETAEQWDFMDPQCNPDIIHRIGGGSIKQYHIITDIVCSSFCGDGIHATATEECDDGNTDNTDDCTNECKIAVCGDGYDKQGLIEQCDDGNTNNFDECTTDCKPAFCGDGYVQENNNELCDDGNKINNDGCSFSCIVEEGYQCSGDTQSVCNSVCGDGIKMDDESCDDGNNIDSDGCSSTCQLETFNENCKGAFYNCDDIEDIEKCNNIYGCDQSRGCLNSDDEVIRICSRLSDDQCDLVLDCGRCGDNRVDIFRNEYLIFVSTTETDGSISFDGKTGIEAANAICQSEADGTGFDGEYVALLSSSEQNIKDKIKDNIFETVSGNIIANSKSELFSGSIEDNIRGTNSGMVNAYIWTGSNIEGNFIGDDCVGWTSHATGSEPYYGVQYEKDSEWISKQGNFDCSDKLDLYCVKVSDDYSEEYVEECDDGNDINNDGCSTKCTLDVDPTDNIALNTNNAKYAYSNWLYINNNINNIFDGDGATHVTGEFYGVPLITVDLMDVIEGNCENNGCYIDKISFQMGKENDYYLDKYKIRISRMDEPNSNSWVDIVDCSEGGSDCAGDLIEHTFDRPIFAKYIQLRIESTTHYESSRYHFTLKEFAVYTTDKEVSCSGSSEGNTISGIPDNLESFADCGQFADCQAGEVELCGYDANKNGVITEADNIGICRVGKRSCSNEGVWSDCYRRSSTQDYVLPKNEWCNNKDDDCNGLVDEDEEGDEGDLCDCGTRYRDDDNDGYGNAAHYGHDCGSVDGWARYSGDCNQWVGGDPDFCDTLPLSECSKLENNVCAKCTNPGRTELCDNIDNNCDGSIDEGLTQTCSTACGSGTEVCTSGQWNSCSALQPVQESCDGADNDCDGNVDEENAVGCQTYYYDQDEDGYGLEIYSKCLCSSSGLYSIRNSDDCDNTNPKWRIFMTQGGHTTNLGGLAGADEICMNEAVNTVSTKDSRWVALLSTADVDAIDRLTEGEFYNMNNVKMADSIDDLFDDPLTEGQQPMYDIFGQHLTNLVLTGSSRDGLLNGNTCDNWDSTSSSYYGQLGLSHRIHGWFSNTAWTCNDDYQSTVSIYCVEVKKYDSVEMCDGVYNDCNDNSVSINPGVIEVCDSLDNDCDSLVDEGFPDLDNDGTPDCEECVFDSNCDENYICFENKCIIEMPYDLNGDKSVNTADAMVIISDYLDTTNEDSKNDVNGDGAINTADAMVIINEYLGGGG
jgi:cysteine-rich repeat protein